MRTAVAIAHDLLRRGIAPGDAVIDATAGNGHDTLFLAQLTGPGGIVFAFDVQPAALAATRRRLNEAGLPRESCQLIPAGHETMRAAIPSALHGRIAAVVFNLGYLPGGDKSLTTTAATTIPAIQTALDLLRPGGLLVAVLYTGHPGGAEEAAAVRTFAESLPSVWSVREQCQDNTLRPAPSVLSLQKPPAAAPDSA